MSLAPRFFGLRSELAVEPDESHLISNPARWLFDPSGLTPHGSCLIWEPWLIWTHAVADIAIGLT